MDRDGEINDQKKGTPTSSGGSPYPTRMPPHPNFLALESLLHSTFAAGSTWKWVDGQSK